MVKKANITEIFESIQGEGLAIGQKQLFIRFSGCNLDCNYCDTNTDSFEIYTSTSLIKKMGEYNFNKIHSISLTGGEPLLHVDFLIEFMAKMKKLYPKIKFYLETNATLWQNVGKILEYTDIIAADIKLPSSTGIDSFEEHSKFFAAVKDYRVNCAVIKQFNCVNKNIYAKIVFNGNITDSEIIKSTDLAKKYNLEIILQPEMNGDVPVVSGEKIISVFNDFLEFYPFVRVIPQSHKILSVE